jgi:hypothetical protein
MSQNKNGGYGNITYGGNGGKNLTVDANPNTTGNLTMTSETGDLVQCYWDGSQWVCNSISFKNTFVQLNGAAAATALNKKRPK